MIASHIAFQYFNGLKDESKELDLIKVVITYSTNISIPFEHSTESLEQVNDRMLVANKVVELLKTKNWVELKSVLNNDRIQVKGKFLDKAKMIPDLESAQKELGDITSFTPRGFRIAYINGVKYLAIFGVLTRTIQSCEFKIVVELDSKNLEIFDLQYAF